jgi:hypothetical protein
MEKFVIIITIFLFTSCKYLRPDKSNTDQNLLLNSDSIFSARSEQLNFDKKAFRFIDTTIIRNIQDSILSYIKHFEFILNDQKYIYAHYNRNTELNLNALKLYYASYKFVPLYDNPIERNIIDSITLFDTVLVPIVNKWPYSIEYSFESGGYLTLCIKDSKFLFFDRRDCIDESHQIKLSDTLFLLEANTNVLTTVRHKNYKVFPDHYTVRSINNGFILYDSLARDYNSWYLTFVKYFDIKSWHEFIVDTGRSPVLIENDSKVFYFKQNKDSYFYDRYIYSYDIQNQSINYIITIPDSLLPMCCGPDDCLSKYITQDSYKGHNCYSVEVFNNDCDHPDVKNYILYFSEIQGILAIKLK